jgi:hypothetical protein
MKPISARNLTTFNGKAKLHRTLVAIGLLECDLLAYKFGQLIFGSLHEALTRRLCNPFWLNHSPVPWKRYATVTREQSLGFAEPKCKNPRRLAVNSGHGGPLQVATGPPDDD